MCGTGVTGVKLMENQWKVENRKENVLNLGCSKSRAIRI